jgi:hypothetical protein
MKTRWIGTLLSLVIVMLWSYSIYADLTPKEILHKADEARGNLEGITWKVYAYSFEKGSDPKHAWKSDVTARGYDFLALVFSPAKSKGQKLLMINHNMWFTKPGLKKPVPVSPRQKLIGDAVYGDIAATNYADDYEAATLDDEKVDEEWCYVFDLKSIKKRTTYDRIKYWVSRDQLVAVKAEYYTLSGKLFKSATFEYDNKITIRNQQRPFISSMTISDALIKDNVTTMVFSNYQIKKISAATFDLNLLMMK